MVMVSRTSMISGKTHEMDIPLTEEEYAAGLEKKENGFLIQDAFPTLNEDHREFLLTGITPEEWDATFPEEDEDTSFNTDEHFGLDDDFAF